MVALLKQKSKIIINRKERTKYEVSGVFKKLKTEQSNASVRNAQPQKPVNEKGQGNTTKKITPVIVEKYD